MAIADVLAKTEIDPGFTEADRLSIIAVITAAYNGSATAKKMFDDWVAAGKKIEIKFEANDAFVTVADSVVHIDVAFFVDNTYINDNGKAVDDTLLTGLIHELVHALTGKSDNDGPLDYRGDTVTFSNIIYEELGLDPQNSYSSYDSTGNLHVRNFDYSGGTPIDRSTSRNGDISTWPALFSNDVLIGGAGANRLEAGLGNDFLVGNGGDDYLNGGMFGTDTVILFGNPVDYDIRLNDDGTWTSRHVRGSANEGTDTFVNLEKVRFAGSEQIYNLVQSGLTFQRDIAFVVDQTGSMFDDIAAVKATATSIIDGLFASNTIDARIGIVGFRDTTNGEPTTIILPFTDQDTFEARKTAALAGINAIGVGGGGDFPETAFDGLLKALNGSMGEWRVGAGTKQIVLFTDATAKDAHLLPTVLDFALSIGASISASASSALGSFGAVDTFELSFGETASRDPMSEGDDYPTYEPSDDEIQFPGGTATIQVFTIFIETFIEPDPNLADLSDQTGGEVLLAANADDVVALLLSVITTPPGGGEELGIAVEDRFFSHESEIVVGNLFEDHDFGADTPGSDPLAIGAVDGFAALVGTDYQLASGATVRVEADGSLIYTPGPGFELMGGPLSGATNRQLFDSFTYTLADGSSATVSFFVNGVDTADILIGSGGLDNLNAGLFDDLLLGFAGADVLDGGPGNDTASYQFDQGGVFVNLTLGQGFGNAAHGDTYFHIENVIGTGANDFLIGNTGVNRLDGGGGNDILIGAVGADPLFGGPGSDWASYEDNSGTVFVNMLLGRGWNNAAHEDTYNGIENLIGGLFDDFFIGDHGANRLVGAMGADTLVGNGGADVFAFTYAPGATSGWGGANVDTLLDMTSGEDTIELLAAAFAGMSAGPLAAGAFVNGTTAGDADDRILYDQSTGNLWFDADGNGGGAAVLFAVVENKPALASTDFAVA